MSVWPRLYAIVDAGVAAQAGWTPSDLARAYLDGGARLLQLRASGVDPATQLGWCQAIVRLVAPLGARVIEKHYTLDNRLPGPDHGFALVPHELKAMVESIRAAEETLGSGVKEVLAEEDELAKFARRGLQATRAIEMGEVFRENDNFAILRPGNRSLGAHPSNLGRVEGKRASRAISLGDGISPDDCQKEH